jgi:hypothetical protein
MADITAAMVKDLREKSGAGMMDCKKALGEAGGDMDAALDWLRTKGLAAAAKKSSRTAAEGLVGVEVRTADRVRDGVVGDLHGRHASSWSMGAGGLMSGLISIGAGQLPSSSSTAGRVSAISLASA